MAVPVQRQTNVVGRATDRGTHVLDRIDTCVSDFFNHIARPKTRARRRPVRGNAGHDQSVRVCVETKRPCRVMIKRLERGAERFVGTDLCNSTASRTGDDEPVKCNKRKHDRRQEH